MHIFRRRLLVLHFLNTINLLYHNSLLILFCCSRAIAMHVLLPCCTQGFSFFQESSCPSSQPLSGKNEDFGKSCYEKPTCKQPTFQIHVDEPEGACTKKPQQVVEPVKPKSITEDSPLTVNNAVARLRQPLATLDVPSAMDVSFGEL